MGTERKALQYVMSSNDNVNDGQSRAREREIDNEMIGQMVELCGPFGCGRKCIGTLERGMMVMDLKVMRLSTLIRRKCTCECVE